MFTTSFIEYLHYYLRKVWFVLLTLPLSTGCEDSSHKRPHPWVIDPDLQLELIVQDPDIVTPIGLTIDSKDQIYVLESHTHQAPKNYQGPSFDRIKKGIDRDLDGIPESWTVFADSIEDGMNLACDKSDRIYLTEKDKVWVFEDKNGDGVSDFRNLLLIMNPPDNVYDHAGILGLTIDEEWLYVSRGNTGGHAWTITGTDCSTLFGYGDGGNVMRCKLDGSELEEVATGFWNPFDIKFTTEGRLMLVDNDPDSRGPNRLVEVAPGGDYGYESLYGGSGIHPFLAWNGELPGTLPYAAGLGEAPSGLIDANVTHLSNRYEDHILCTIWEENSIVHVKLQPHQSTVRGQAKALIRGDSTFHPVALATNSKGDIYITDWVVRQYPNHGKGKIWRLSSGNAESTHHAQKVRYDNDPQERVFQNRYGPWDTEDHLLTALRSEDPFVQTSARYHLISTESQQLIQYLDHPEKEVRLQSILALTHTSLDIPKSRLQTLLNDAEKDIRHSTLIYIAKHSREDMLQDILSVVKSGDITSEDLEMYLAVVRHLQPSFIQALESQSEKQSKSLPRKLSPGFIWQLVNDSSLPLSTRAAALPYLKQPDTLTTELLILYESANPELQEAILKLFQQVQDEEIAQTLVNTALDLSLTETHRAQALVSLSYQRGDYCEKISSLTLEENALISLLAQKYTQKCGDHRKGESLPENDREWENIVNESGNTLHGQYLFQFATTQCQNCHQVNGWGGHFGPDLSHVGSSKSRELLIRAILQPSAEISPEWQGWYVEDQEGKRHYGRQIDVGGNSVEIMSPTGEFITYQKPNSFGLAPASLMPEGLEMTLSPTEFNDLIAYLQSLK